MVVDLGGQALSLFKRGQRLADYRVSTAQNGPGEKQGSGCTPRGLHAIRLKIGKGCETNTVFVGRRPTGEIYGPDLERAYPERDWILTRILWLTGREQGRNRGGERDTLRRYIYIHGTPDNQPMGKPCSHGCIRMRNTDLLELFDRIEVGTQVEIRE
ncbi:MAG: L,D-transpeptidase [Gammaproteobacteria bacterium]|nr:L,D-transpeptidase [Gammaproteobacteria bacterium]